MKTGLGLSRLVLCLVCSAVCYVLHKGVSSSELDRRQVCDAGKAGLYFLSDLGYFLFLKCLTGCPR